TTPPPTGTWTPGRAYRAGDGATYAGLAYRCLQAHTAVVGWEPPNVPALWQRL
ncbi:dioxygenase, partial [Streptomyces sp. WAC07061]